MNQNCSRFYYLKLFISLKLWVKCTLWSPSQHWEVTLAHEPSLCHLASRAHNQYWNWLRLPCKWMFCIINVALQLVGGAVTRRNVMEKKRQKEREVPRLTNFNLQTHQNNIRWKTRWVKKSSNDSNLIYHTLRGSFMFHKKNKKGYEEIQKWRRKIFPYYYLGSSKKVFFKKTKQKKNPFLHISRGEFIKSAVFHDSAHNHIHPSCKWFVHARQHFQNYKDRLCSLL